MPSPRPREPEPVSDPVRATTPSPARKSEREPKRISPSIQRAEPRGIDTFPLSSLVGEDSLAPYVWVTLKGDEGQDTGNTFRTWGTQAPSRHGLRSVRITNEKGKYPAVEVEIYVPQYRKGSANDEHERGASLRKFRVGAEFSIKWGYRAAHTKWGMFRVMERDIEFSQGTALLTFKGVMGYKMSSSTTADVFSTSFGVSSIEKLARLVNMDLSLDDLDDDQRREIETSNSETVTAGNTIASSIYKDAQKLDLEMLYDPESDALRLVTPFKLDLISKGSKPVKMTYGFPDSPIERLDVETKHPIKAGRGPRQTKGVIGSGIDQKSGTVTSVVVGTVRVSGKEDLFINYGYVAAGLPLPTQYLDVSAFPNGPNDTVDVEQGVQLTGSKVIENAERRYPPSKGYIVSINTELNRYAPAAKAGYYHVIVQRKFKLNAKWRVIRDDFGTYLRQSNDSSLQLNWASPLDISNFSNRANKGALAFIIQGAPVLIGGVNRFPIKVYGSATTQVQGTPPPPSDERTFMSTKNTTEPRSDLGQAPEGEEFIDVSGVARTDDQYVRSDILNYSKMGAPLSSGAKSQLERFKAAEARLKAEASKRDDQRVVRRNIGLNTVAVLQVRKPEDTSSGEEESAESADTATNDSSNPKSDTVPLGVSSGRARASRKLSLMTLKIKMKSGDWTLKTGKLIEIIDVYESINGIYYIHGEEHIIDDSGFSTEITCKKATSKQISRYGTTRKFKKGTRKPKSGENADKNKAAQAKANSSVVSNQTQRELAKDRAKKARIQVLEDDLKNKSAF